MINKEEREKVYKAYTKLAARWLELGGGVMLTLEEGKELERLRKAKAKIEEGINTILLSCGVQRR